MPRQLEHGLSLIDFAMAVSCAGVMAAMALPSYQDSLARARREEAIRLMDTIRLAQEDFRARTGQYAPRLSQLAPSEMSTGSYRIALVSADPDGYILRAWSLDELAQNGGCHQLSLSVMGGVATHGPTDRCWNR